MTSSDDPFHEVRKWWREEEDSLLRHFIDIDYIQNISEAIRKPMLERIYSALSSHICGDPGFYAFKAHLRKDIPDADMIEIAEDVVTVVRGQSVWRFAY